MLLKRHPLNASGCLLEPRLLLSATLFVPPSHTHWAWHHLALSRVELKKLRVFWQYALRFRARRCVVVRCEEFAGCQVFECPCWVPKWRASLPQDGGPMPPSTSTTLVKVSVLWNDINSTFKPFCIQGNWCDLWWMIEICVLHLHNIDYYK